MGGAAFWAEGRAHSCPSCFRSQPSKDGLASGLPKVIKGMPKPKQAKEGLGPMAGGGFADSLRGLLAGHLPNTSNRRKRRLWGRAIPKQGLSTWGP